jgi:hypothetical protein
MRSEVSALPSAPAEEVPIELSIIGERRVKSPTFVPQFVDEKWNENNPVRATRSVF